MRGTLAMAVLLCPSPALCDTILVVAEGEAEGEGDAVAAEMAARGHDVRPPAEVRALLEERDREDAPDPEAARSLVAEGREAYTNLDFPTAVSKLSRAVEAYLAAAREVPVAETAQVHLDLGIAHLAAGARAEAAREIALAIRLDGTLRVDPARHGPPTRRFVEGVRRDLSRARTLRRTVTTRPAGAEIRVDGELRGTSPLTLADLPEGSHYLTAEMRGHATVTLRIEVEGPSEDPIDVALPPDSAARRALEALEAGQSEEASPPAREALDADAALAVSREGTRLRGTYVPRLGDVRRATAPDAEALVLALFEPLSPSLVGLAQTAPTAPVERTSSATGPPWWVWTGGAVAVALGTAAAIILLANGSEGPGEVDLVPGIERR